MTWAPRIDAMLAQRTADGLKMVDDCRHVSRPRSRCQVAIEASRRRLRRCWTELRENKALTFVNLPILHTACVLFGTFISWLRGRTCGMFLEIAPNLTGILWFAMAKLSLRSFDRRRGSANGLAEISGCDVPRSPLGRVAECLHQRQHALVRTIGQLDTRVIERLAGSVFCSRMTSRNQTSRLESGCI
jgi:hypothetical protein